MDITSWNRLTLQSRNIVLHAHRLSVERGAAALGFGPLLEALFAVHDTLAYRFLERMGIDNEAALARLRASAADLEPEDLTVTGAITGLARRAEELLDAARAKADQRSDAAIGAEYLLIAFLSSPSPLVRLVFGETDLLLRGVQAQLQQLEPVGPYPYDPENAFLKRLADSTAWLEEAWRNRPVVERLRALSKTATGAVLATAVRDAAEQDPRNYFLRISLSDILFEQGAFDECLYHLGIAVAVDPTGPLAYRRMARAAQRNDQPERAQNLLETGWPFFETQTSKQYPREDRAFWFSVIDS